jgi:hypothetical protein|tara:strand:- start:1112 stop:2011 length:900 start_codon:yes stop_codon:yes gene_type:complete
MGIFNEFSKKEKPVFTGLKFGFGSGGGDGGSLDISATGGEKFTSGSDTYHVFTSSGSFTVSADWSPSISVKYLIVGGGGPNGSPVDMTAGGGGGGVLTGSNAAFDGGESYDVTLNVPVNGTVNGGNSSVVTTPGTLESTGGAYAPRSTGGESGNPQNNAGGSAFPYSGSPINITNGGGGGAGEVGGNGGSATGGGGGGGLACPEFPGPVIGPNLNVPGPEITAFNSAVGPTGLYGGGGGGGTFGSSHVASGGPGGGGDGASGGEAGVNYTGGGAGGDYPGTAPTKRLGGKGLVVLKYSI